MAPKGPILPRRDTALARARQSLESVAFQLGVIVAIQRNRWQWTQGELASEIAVKQIDISRIENGQPASISDPKMDELFRTIGLPANSAQANFLKWWRDNSTL